MDNPTVPSINPLVKPLIGAKRKAVPVEAGDAKRPRPDQDSGMAQ